MRATAIVKVRAVKACRLRVFYLRNDFSDLVLNQLSQLLPVPEEGAAAIAFGLS